MSVLDFKARVDTLTFMFITRAPWIHQIHLWVQHLPTSCLPTWFSLNYVVSLLSYFILLLNSRQFNEMGTSRQRPKTIRLFSKRLWKKQSHSHIKQSYSHIIPIRGSIYRRDYDIVIDGLIHYSRNTIVFPW